MELRIEVESVDIAVGTPGDGNACPIFHALARRLPQGRASVHDDALEIEIGERLICFDIPDEAQAFIAAFDSGRAVGPIAFTAVTVFEPPAEVRDLFRAS
jgi:hypothetical protein